VSPERSLERPLRIALFTDTLGDVNGVSRFIRTIAEQPVPRSASGAPGELHVLTSTRFACPDRPNIHNLPPRYSRPMPGYPTLDIVIPNSRALRRCAAEIQPDAVHVSTPGPVGLVGRRYALKHRLPLLGTYHTDFPAYIDHLFGSRAMTRACLGVMRWFYRPFARVFTRSLDYAAALERIGVDRTRIVRLLAGIDTTAFDPRRCDPAIWRSVEGVRAASVKVLYVGRVSVEKNLPMLAAIWPRVRAACLNRGLDVQLVVVGGGPYLDTMKRELAPDDAAFAGFRHGDELSAIYASGDLFVFPSATDTLGQAVMEAECSGLPVLISDQGGPKEIVDDGLTGLVLPVPPAPNAERRWIDAMVSLIGDPERRARMGAAASAKIKPMSIRTSFEHFWSVHEEAVREHAAAK